jgi:hypothetical protein
MAIGAETIIPPAPGTVNPATKFVASMLLAAVLVLGIVFAGTQCGCQAIKNAENPATVSKFLKAADVACILVADVTDIAEVMNICHIEEKLAPAVSEVVAAKSAAVDAGVLYVAPRVDGGS